jgi:predicted ArsR family transcriptional regulator
MGLDRLAAVGEPGLRRALVFARTRPGGFTADEAAAALGVHRNVARSRLERLAATGLIRTSFASRSGGPGAGRPAKLYSVAPELESIEFPTRRYGELVGLLLDEVPGTQALRAVGERFGHHLAQEARLRPAEALRPGLERMGAALAGLGFPVAIAGLRGETAELATPTCPLRPLVVERPEAAELDRGMWAGLVSSAVRGVEAQTVRCETGGCAEAHASCRILLRVRQDTSASGDTASR